MTRTERRYENLRWIFWMLVGAVLFLTLAFVLGAGCYFLFTRVLVEIPSGNGNYPFKDVLQTVLAVAGIAITAFGYGAYKLLSYQIEKRIARNVERNTWVANTRQKIDTGFLYWDLYLLLDGKPQPTRLTYLNKAIEETQEAYERAARRLNQKEWQVERLLMNIRNNWAYFIYEKDHEFARVAKGERKTALDCLDYLAKRVTKYPDLRDETLDTIQKVANHFRSATPRFAHHFDL